MRLETFDVDLRTTVEDVVGSAGRRVPTRRGWNWPALSRPMCRPRSSVTPSACARS